MCLFSNFIEDLYEYLTGERSCTGNIIRRHTKKLDQLGDVSFPLNIKNWQQFTPEFDISSGNGAIFDFSKRNEDLTTMLDKLLVESKSWHLQVESYKIIENTDVHLYLNRSKCVDLCIKDVVSLKENYGFEDKIFSSLVQISLDQVDEMNLSTLTLTELRMICLRNISRNLLSRLTQQPIVSEGDDTEICITINSQKNGKKIVCGSVINESGIKDTTTTARQLWEKRTIDMQLMAQHKYGVRVKGPCLSYFEKLGKASTTLELLQNKPHKNIKIALNDIQTTNKGPAFIFYNCARLSALFKEFESRVNDKIYPPLPSILEIDFYLLTQPEEWELVYVYLLQFPSVLNTCVGDIKNGNINPQHLISFLSNLVSIFSVYYRRVKVLTIAKQHLFPVLFARIYLLKALQHVLHTCLFLLDIEPVNEM